VSRVIRGGTPPARVVPGELVDARAEAARIVDDARAEAARIVSDARSAAAGVLDDARAQGLAAGRVEAAATLAGAARARDAMLAGAEREVRTLALAVAAKIVGETVALDPERSLVIAREALSRARRAERLELRVHPDDLATLAAALPSVQITGDTSIARGGCVVRSELGTVDARIETQLAAIAAHLGCDPP
jgi:type III secretion system HrpE/YscL family protein